MKKNVQLLVIIVTYILIHLISIFTIAPEKTLDGYNDHYSDSTYYLDGAKSLLQYNYVEKFNNKHQPITKSSPIAKEDMNEYSSLIAALYPFPSFKYGYSLSAALISLPLGNEIFIKYIPRLAYANFVFGLVILVLLYSILKKSINENAAIITSLFFIFDTFNINNNYAYQSHTICGIMFNAIAYYIIFNSKYYTNKIILIIGILFSLSILSSSHNFIFSISSIFLFFLYLIFNKVVNNRLISFLSFTFGLTIFPLYIFSVEKFLNFRKLGINTYLEQNIEYSRIVRQLINSFSIYDRQIWDIRIWNQFIVYIFILILFLFLYDYIKNKKNSYNINIKINLNKKEYIFFTSSLFYLIGTIFYTFPIARAMVPELLLIDIYLGIIFGFLLKNFPYKYLIIFILTSFLSTNFINYISVVKIGNYGLGFINSAPNRYLEINDQEIIWENVRLFFKDQGFIKMESGQLGIYSLSLEDFFQSIQKQGLNLNSIDENVWVKINPMDIIMPYTNTRRVLPEFNPNSNNIITSDIIRNDFKLLFEIFNCVDIKDLDNNNILRFPIKVWNPTFFDQEFNYIYGYKGKIKPYLINSSLSNIDLKSTYYINLKFLYEKYKHNNE